jgi:hypothetical protein
MATAQANVFERFNDALREIDTQLGELRERLDRGRRGVESRMRDALEDGLRELRRTPVYRRTNQARKDLEAQLEQGRERIYGALGIASKDDVARIERRISTLSRKINELARDVSGS